eukprot:scaffold287_cov151-Skeletonema_marinoi.AAC.13
MEGHASASFTTELSTANSRTYERCRCTIQVSKRQPDDCMHGPNLHMHSAHKSGGKIRTLQ